MRTVRFLGTMALFAAFALWEAPLRAQQGSSQAAGGDSVAEAARKAREQKKNAGKVRRVLTDDDVAPRPSEARATVPGTTAPGAEGSTPAASEGKPSAEKPEDKDPPNSEPFWRKKFAAQRRKIADAELELDVLKRELEKSSVQYYADPQKAMNEQFSRKEINDKNEKIEAKQKEIAALHQQLSALEEELRRTGGDPGWAR